MILPPIAAWIGTWNMCGGISSLSFSTIARPRLSARVRWTSIASASTDSLLTRMCMRTTADGLKSGRCEVNDRLVVYQDVQASEVRRIESGEVIVERRVPLRPRLQPVVEIEHDFVE